MAGVARLRNWVDMELRFTAKWPYMISKNCTVKWPYMIHQIVPNHAPNRNKP